MPDQERESAIAMDLAQRAYLYRVLHVAFGSRPTAESASRVFGEETLAAFEYVREILGRAGFGALAGRPAGSAGRTLAACVGDAVVCVREARREAADAQRAEGFVSQLQSDYDRLFQVPGELYVHLWESPYTGKESMVFQESTLEVRAFYHEAGFKLRAEKRFPDDHIAAMMDYMGCLGQRAYEAFADGCDSEAARTLATQRRFADRHILTWVDMFAGKVIENDAHGLFGALAGAMAAFSHVDRVLIERLERELAER